MKNNVIVIPLGDNANLRIRKDKIVATVNTTGSDHIDIYVDGAANPWHVYNYPSDKLVDLIWEGDNE